MFSVDPVASSFVKLQLAIEKIGKLLRRRPATVQSSRQQTEVDAIALHSRNVFRCNMLKARRDLFILTWKGYPALEPEKI